jgi:plasmid stabilization system protein ParE
LNNKSSLQNPAIGERSRTDPTGKIRHRTIIGFCNYVIFYPQEGETLQILRVLHRARDYSQLFEQNYINNHRRQSADE